ncbi:MAG: DUF1592 domain-containing protein [Verrucomicrobiales bacterium]|nr:DUF1592 domain-containing protein [Verrucomicrobiales bacterium]
MKRFFFFILFFSGVSFTTAKPFSPDEFIASYCLECHDEDVQKGDRSFEELGNDFSDLYTMEAWQEILDQLNLGEMPPKKADQPTSGESMAMVNWVTAELTKARESLDADLARPVLRRLNKSQYDQTVRSLLDLHPMLADPTETFPPDVKVEHFDTVGSALVMSDFLLNSYLASASLLVEKATCTTPEAPKTQKWEFQAPFSRLPARPDGLDVPGEYQHIRKNPTFEDGYLWLDKFTKGVPHDGWYDITFKAKAVNRNYPYDEDRVGVAKDEKLRVSVITGNADYGDLKAANGSDRPLFTVDLPDDKPEVFQQRVWLDRGYQPRFTFPNGPNRTKPLRSYTVVNYPGRFQDFLQFIKPGDNEFRGLDPAWLTGEKARHPATQKKGGKLDATQFYTNKNSNEGWIAWTKDFEGPRVRLYEISIEGPFFQEWPTRSHEMLYSGYEPTLENAEMILRRFAARAFRRPATKPELDSLLTVTRDYAAAGNSELDSIQAGLKAVLCSPGFLFLEKEENATDPEKDYALASRLSYFLWSDMPDYGLKQLATSGKLRDPEEYRKTVLGMIGDARSDQFIDSFTGSWLQLEKVGTQPPSQSIYPEYYTQSLEEAMLEETRLFARHLLRENLSIENFLQSDFTFLNGNLARHYHIDHVVGHHFRKVKLFDRRRGGLLGHASVLTASANGIDTSPVIRGIYVLENILGTPPTPPPPDVEPIEPDIRGVTTIREQLIKHREVETCAECHEKIDPIGFALENYDPIGGWRIRYMETGKKPMVDASGQFPDGTGFKDAIELKSELLERRRQFAHALTEKLLIYGTGRTMTITDRHHIDRIVHDLEEKGWGFGDLVLLVTESRPFVGKR